MFKSKVISQPGIYHIHNHTLIEDHYSLKQNDALAVAVLCDGAGSAQYGSTAAKIISRLLSKYIYENFYTIFGALSDIVLREVTQMIDGKLIEYSNRKSIDVHEMASTVMAVAMDRNGRCICLHLGDGIILRKNKSDTEFDIVSSPQNGISENTTYLTMNCSIAEKMKFYRWNDDDIFELVLMTDGAYGCVFENCGGVRRSVVKDNPIIKSVSKRYKSVEDDCSCVVLERIE